MMRESEASLSTGLSILRAPGHGLLTVSTGADAAASFVKKYFKKHSSMGWVPRLTEVTAAEHPWLIGVPSDSGGGICRGAAHGPLALRQELYARDRFWSAFDLGDVPCIPQLVHDSMLNEIQREASARSLWGVHYSEGSAASPLSLLEDLLVQIWRRYADFRPFILGGDHSISGPVFAAMDRVGKTQRLAVLHIDAHTDLLESRFGVQHCFGTWTSHALKTLGNPMAWVQIGIRASGKDKQHWESGFGLKQYWSRELVKKDPLKFADELCDHWRSLGCDSLYITNDIDGTDAAWVPATGTPEVRGLNPLWLRKVLSRVSSQLSLVGADMMEVAPVLGPSAGARKTVKTAVNYIEALRWK